MNQENRKFIIISVILFLLSSLSFAQSVSIATWKNDASGAYSIVHDDLGISIANGLQTHADTCYRNRGLTASFGAVTEGAGSILYYQGNDWLEYGHWFTNHTWSHPAASTSWWEDSEQYYMEIDSSKALMEQFSGGKIIYLVFPENRWNNDVINYIRTHGYIGCRAGNEGNGLNDADLPDPFACNYRGFDQNLSGLHNSINTAISDGKWCQCMFHGVEDDSYDSAPLEDFQAHLDFCKSKVDAGDLWMAPVEPVIQYIKVRENLTAAVDHSNTDSMVITLTVGGSLDSALYATPITFIIETPSGYSNIGVVQNDVQVTHEEISDNTIHVHANPFNGELTVYADYDVSVEKRPIIQPIFSTSIGCPNPIYTGAVISVAGGKTDAVYVYGMDGRLIHRISTNQGHFVWTGIGQDHKRLSNGYYILRTELAVGNNSAKRVLFAR